MEMHTSPVCRDGRERGQCPHQLTSPNNAPPLPHPLERPGGVGWERQAHLIDVGVPHLGQEPKGWRGVRVVDGELEACLGGGQRAGRTQPGPALLSPQCCVWVWTGQDRTGQLLQTLPINTEGHRPGMAPPAPGGLPALALVGGRALVCVSARGTLHAVHTTHRPGVGPTTGCLGLFWGHLS